MCVEPLPPTATYTTILYIFFSNDLKYLKYVRVNTYRRSGMGLGLDKQRGKVIE